jgi:flavin reductase (DIM6/NTAB) family NADH-FMN oxidoreductase RutF
MLLEFAALSPQERYHWLASSVIPRPIAWVSSLSAAGVANLAPFSFFQVISDEPATLMINVASREGVGLKDTLRNAQTQGELVIHVVSHAQIEAMNASAVHLPPEISEFDHCGIASMPSTRVAPPRIKAAALAFECRVLEVLPYPRENPNHHLIFAEVLLAHVDDGVLCEKGRIDPRRLDLVGRLGGSAYSRTRETFELPRPI